MTNDKPSPSPFLDRWKWVILLLAGLATLGGLAYLMTRREPAVRVVVNPPAPTHTHTASPPPSPTPSPAPLEIYVTGAVARPETRLSLPLGARVEDAIAAVGGATDQADLSRVNLAQVLRDGDQVHVPTLPSPEQAPLVDETPTSNAPRRVNINTATLEELQTLPRIGESTARAIIAYREQNGPFTSVDDLDQVRGIGSATLEGLRDLVTVE